MGRGFKGSKFSSSYVDEGELTIDYVVDINPQKQGDSFQAVE